MKVNGHWVHDLNPYAIRFPNSWPLDGIRWYGIAYLLGFLSAYLIFHLYRLFRRVMLDKGQIDSLLTHLLIGAVAGGRLGYVLLYEVNVLVCDPLETIHIWHGGMSSHGGFVGVALAIYCFSRRYRLAPLAIADAVVSVAPLGIFFGRVANFINGELYGRASNVLWAVVFPRATSAGNHFIARHPSQIYEALAEGLLLFIYVQTIFWIRKTKERFAGNLMSKFLIAYSLLRIFCEHFREPDAPLILGITRGQFYSVFTLFCGCGLTYALRRKWQVKTLGPGIEKLGKNV
ncbi:MAG: prolipoprotein diacylglyceryl transferase [Puniceicoccales bacterium]|jgi:phosphatidylglycerol:prolipoprotein diacylglycerol transferase|nr:prolipoprotein diacylglyceryl transferase [Puniceicoccales bacterium]